MEFHSDHHIEGSGLQMPRLSMMLKGSLGVIGRACPQIAWSLGELVRLIIAFSGSHGKGQRTLLIWDVKIEL